MRGRARRKVARRRKSEWKVSLDHRNPSRSNGTQIEKNCEETPTSPEFIDSKTLNFRPNFKSSRIKLFGGTPVPLVCALASFGQSVARVKI